MSNVRRHENHRSFHEPNRQFHMPSLPIYGEVRRTHDSAPEALRLPSLQRVRHQEQGRATHSWLICGPDQREILGVLCEGSARNGDAAPL